MLIVFHNKEYTASQFVLKVLLFFPRKTLHFFSKINIKEKIEILQLQQIMNHEGVGRQHDEYILRKKITHTLKKAHKYVPYYKKFVFLDKINCKNCYMLLKQLPLVNKETFSQEKERMYNSKKYYENYPAWGHTGGTTGKPLTFPRSENAEDSHQKALYQYMTGMSFSQIMKNPYGIVSFSGTRPKYLGSEEKAIEAHIFWLEDGSGIYGSLDFCSFYETEEKLPYYITKLNEIKPYIIRGYSNAILTVARFQNKTKTLNHFPKAIYVTSEQCSLASMNEISRAFNCPVFGQYGQTEASFFAWTKPNSDTYYVSPYYGFVEVLDEKGDTVKEGQFGELTVTAFGNSVQPWIRYKTGDIVKYNGIHNGVVWLSGIKGRYNDFFINYDKDKVYYVGFFDIHYLKCGKKIIQCQVQQDTIGKVILRVITDKTWQTVDENEIIELFRKRNIDVAFEYTDSIPLTAKGKQKLIIQNVSI